jgi:transposase
VDLSGPTRLDYHWQAQAGAGCDAQHFPVDGNQQHASCPAGKTSLSWPPAVDNRGNAVIKVKFSPKDGRPCPQLALGVRSQKRSPRRTITIRPQPQDHAFKPHGSGKRRRDFRRSMRAALGLRAPFRVGYEAHVCDAPALEAWRGAISATS